MVRSLRDLMNDECRFCRFYSLVLIAENLDFFNCDAPSETPHSVTFLHAHNLLILVAWSR